MSHSVNIGAVLDAFDLLIMLGEGDQGEVWLARDRLHRRLIAVKLLHPGGKDRSATLMRWKALGEHPNVVRVLEAHGSAAQPCFSMEYVDGPSLRMVLEQLSPSQRLPLPVAMHLMRGILQALAFAHDGPGHERVVHGGVRPDSVLIETLTGTVKLDDFGLDASDEPVDTFPTRMTDRLRHLAPEQLSGLPPTAATDLYAAGLLLYQLLCGVGPFDDLSMLSLLSPSTRFRPIALDELPAGTPPGLLPVLRRALAPAALDCFSSAREMMAGLERYMPTVEEGARLVISYTDEGARHAEDALDSVEPSIPSPGQWWQAALEQTDTAGSALSDDTAALSWNSNRASA